MVLFTRRAFAAAVIPGKRFCRFIILPTDVGNMLSQDEDTTLTPIVNEKYGDF